MKVKMQKSPVLFPTLDLSDKKLGKKMKAMISPLLILSKICIEVSLNREQYSSQMMVISGSTHRLKMRREDSLFEKSSNFYFENNVLALSSNFSVFELDS